LADIRWSLFAQADAARIARDHQAIDPELARDIAQWIVGATGILADLPRAGPVTARGERRKWRVPRTGYVLFYRIERDHIRILRVLHGAQEQAGKL
jgi:toxin ParE1/3/4